MISLTARIEPTAMSWKYIEDNVYLLNENGAFVLNGTGSKLWTLFDGYRTFGEIVNQIAEEENEQDIDNVANILSEFIEDLVDNGFVIINDNLDEEDW